MSMLYPPITASASLFKIPATPGQGQITFRWSYSDVVATPTSLTLQGEPATHRERADHHSLLLAERLLVPDRADVGHPGLADDVRLGHCELPGRGRRDATHPGLVHLPRVRSAVRELGRHAQLLPGAMNPCELC